MKINETKKKSKTKIKMAIWFEKILFEPRGIKSDLVHNLDLKIKH